MKYTKEQNRTWELQRRIKCHGTSQSCLEVHPTKVNVISESTPNKIEVNKEGLFNKLLKWLKIK